MTNRKVALDFAKFADCTSNQVRRRFAYGSEKESADDAPLGDCIRGIEKTAACVSITRCSSSIERINQYVSRGH